MENLNACSISVEAYNEAIDMVKKLRQKNDSLILENESYKEQIINAQSSLMSLIEANFELKEEIQALKLENEQVISEVESQGNQIKQLTPVANLGSKALELFAEMTNIIDMQKLQQLQAQQEAGDMNVQ